jgi:regulator of sigma E protease
MNMAGPIAAFIVIFSVVVVVHEAGHYLAAKWCRVPISEFSLGFPGTLVVMTLGRYRETAFTIRLLPFGGFVRFGNAGYPEDDGAVFDGLLPSHKAVILVAGSLFNLFTGFLLLVAALMAVRGLGLIDSSKAALELMGQVVSETFSALVYLNFHGVIGPVGAAVVASEVMKQGLWPMVGFAGLMSFSVGIMNLLPVPGFDGWHVVLAGIEAVRGKPFNGRFHALAGAAGFVVIVVLMVAVTFLDVTSIHDVINITCTTR